jgi:DnaJ family protein C protein 7
MASRFVFTFYIFYNFFLDKNAESEESRKKAETMFKDVGEAYSVLSDAKKRARYDQGADLDEIENGGGFGGADVDVNQIFQMFFQGGGGGFGGGHGGHGHSHGGGPRFQSRRGGGRGGFPF